MSVFAWDSKLNMNIPQIDAQHQRLVALISELDHAVQEGTGGLLISYVLQELIRYVGVHFEEEERLMLQHGFPGLEDHITEHNLYVSRLHEIQNSTQDGDQLSSATLDYLKEWILLHIKDTDQIYGRYIRNKLSIGL